MPLQVRNEQTPEWRGLTDFRQALTDLFGNGNAQSYQFVVQPQVDCRGVLIEVGKIYGAHSHRLRINPFRNVKLPDSRGRKGTLRNS